MYRLCRIILCFIIIAVASVDHVSAFSWGGDKTLVTINGMKFYPEDFEHWWENWQEKGMSFPDDLDEFIEWHILAVEADAMELYLEPRFVRKMDVFLKVRGLMMLKAEEVNAKLNIPESALREVYDREYSPVWTISVLGFAAKETAEQVLADLRAEKVTLEQVFEKTTNREEGAPIKIDKEIQLFPQKLPQGWDSILKPLAEGQYAGPVDFQDNYLIIKMLNVSSFNQADFENTKPVIFNNLRKVQQGKLSSELLVRLKEKYHVQVDESLLEQLDILHPQEELLEKSLVTTSNGTFSASIFVGLMKRNLQRVPVEDLSAEEWKNKKMSSLEDLLFQNLTAWEAFDRHYERNEPFKWVYQFYRQHRLIKELEVRVFHAGTETTDAEALQYYQDNLKDYIALETIRIALMQGEEEVISKISREISMGGDFFAVGKKFFSKKPTIEELQFDQLEDIVREAVENLAVGEVTPPFNVKNKRVMVKLVGKNMKEAVPFEQVKNTIKVTLQKDKFKANRDRYLSLLKERSSIKINEKQWEKLHSKHGEQNDN